VGDEHVTVHQLKNLDIPPTQIQNYLVMKPIYSYALLAAFAAVGSALAVDATTTPVGYKTEVLHTGQFNLIGLTLHRPTISAGILIAENSGYVTAGTVSPASTTDFVALLGTPGPTMPTYILELADGSIQEITSWTSDGKLTTPQDITSYVTPGTSTYTLRKASTISDVFGATNTAGLQSTTEFDPGQADIVYVPNGSGGSDQFFYSSAVGSEGWFNAGDFSNGNNTPLVYVDGITVLRKGSDLPLVVSGEIKKIPTKYVLLGGNFNNLGGVYPVGTTLASSGLSNSLKGTDSFDPASADNVFIPLAAGGYQTLFYSNASGAAGWFDAGDFSNGDAVALTTGISILRRGATTAATITPPSGYSTL
jgi:hypothetical protein